MKLNRTILFIHHGGSIGGAATALFETLKKIDRKICRVIVILPEEGPFSDMLAKEGIEYRIIPLAVFYYCSLAKSVSLRKLVKNPINLIKNIFKNIPGNVVHLSAFLKETNPEVVVINSASLLLSGIVAKIMGKRVVWHIREIISTDGSKALINIIAAIISRTSERVIVLSEFSRRNMEALRVKNISLVPDGIDVNKFYRRSVAEDDFLKHGLRRGDKVVGFVGQIFREKGWRTLLEASFLVVDKVPGAKFLIVGTSYMIERKDIKYVDPFKEQRDDVVFRRVVNDMKLNKNFVFLGQRSDVGSILPLMDCLVFPSIAPEPLPHAIMEAMACGIPVVASNIGAVSEMVLDGTTGILFEPGNVLQLSQHLVRFLGDREGKNRLAQAARRRAEEMYDIDKIIPQLEGIYNLTDHG